MEKPGKKLRAWTFKTLSKVGLSKFSGIEDTIHAQCGSIIAVWEKALSSSEMPFAEVEVSDHVMMMPFFKVIFTSVMGADRINDAKNGALLTEMIHLNMEYIMGLSSFAAGLDVAFPFLSRIFSNATGRKVQDKLHSAARKAGQSLLDDVRNEALSSSVAHKGMSASLAHAFLNVMQNNPLDPDFTDFHFTSIYMDLLQGSGESTSAYVQCLLLHCVTHPYWQEKIVSEIYSVIGDGVSPKLEHQRRMPNTEAFMLEVHRTAILTPNLVPHWSTADFKYGEFTIPKNTLLMADIVSAHSDPRIWKNPSEFDPSRFLRPNGEGLCLKTKRQCLPFGAGKRRCPGEPFADAMAFLFFLSILKTFKLGTAPGQSLPKLRMNEGAATFPLPFKMTIFKREKLDRTY
ncbi:steroid 17-alpha-hydroxylase/17,20 lyase [Folsomia candida]|uniref:Cytochrome P450 2U1 n=1 Tax=Folsomia candida TaxID=158441 RepID=A0A226D2H7_FOLCA|nr:steroid 17-alpha-hydroxylase/17,20 lyase [Folsomia candida]XP_035700761.1 steroid 17-alpha-hydroxylase/17,20 lyase [Folsomia candida]OXA38861.1 Cytochrome P450 2U1 [Folsomia candida]